MYDAEKVDRILNTDAMLLAEELGENPIAMLMAANKVREQTMKSLGDTPFNCKYEEYCKAVVSLGFELIREISFIRESNKEQDVWRFYEHPSGAIIKTDSYRGMNDTKIRNSAYLIMAVRAPGGRKELYENDGGACRAWNHNSSDLEVLFGSHDVREGLKHQWNNYFSRLNIVKEWPENDFYKFIFPEELIPDYPVSHWSDPYDLSTNEKWAKELKAIKNWIASSFSLDMAKRMNFVQPYWSEKYNSIVCISHWDHYLEEYWKLRKEDEARSGQ